MIRGNPSNKATSSNSSSIGQGKRRRGLTILEKYDICKRRTESKENEKINLEEFAKLFPDNEILTGIKMVLDPHLNIDLNVSDNWKKKAPRQLFPVLETHISEWVYRAQLARVIMTDDVILAVARKFVQEIVALQDEEASAGEDYTGFEFSSGWLAGLKNWCGLGRVKTQGETEVDNLEAYGIPEIKARLRESLKDFAPRNIYNCDDLALYSFVDKI
ncbi:unnamed protein product [Tuber aestivum]|uniref:HTH CENPB-type domain-containing protein n=1 Tax=Tuber aestivum TaxID=59557 RepID=A0A292PTV7_9PEZI|nr:unnamed protein product [Tuber aestivum]